MKHEDPAPEVVDETLECARCGYLLRGLGPVGKCPECGLEISASLARELVSRSDPIWVHSLALGCAIMAGAIAWELVTTVMGFIPFDIPWGYILTFRNASGYSAPVLVWLAALLLSSTERNRAERRGSLTLRRSYRALASIALIVHLTGVAYWGLSNLVQVISWLVFDLTRLATSVLFLLYLRRLARRVPDALLIRHIPIALAALVITTTIVRLVFWARRYGIASRATTLPPIAEGLLELGANAYCAWISFHAWRRFHEAEAPALENWRNRVEPAEVSV